MNEREIAGFPSFLFIPIISVTVVRFLLWYRRRAREMIALENKYLTKKITLFLKIFAYSEKLYYLCGHISHNIVPQRYFFIYIQFKLEIYHDTQTCYFINY